MTVTPAATTPTPSAATGGTNALNQLSGNFDTFLQLLTTQLQNQDPTAPMDSNQFTQQLVEFSQVEQQINTNSNLQTLITQGQSSTGSYAVSYLGKNVTVTNGQAALTNGQANWNYTLASPAASSTLSVTDANGNVVFSTAGDNGAGSHTFSWDGVDNNGNQLPDGTYSLAVSAATSSGAGVTTSVSSTGQVSEVNMSGTTPQLMIGAMSIPLSSVTSVGN